MSQEEKDSKQNGSLHSSNLIFFQFLRKCNFISCSDSQNSVVFKILAEHGSCKTTKINNMEQITTGGMLESTILMLNVTLRFTQMQIL